MLRYNSVITPYLRFEVICYILQYYSQSKSKKMITIFKEPSSLAALLEKNQNDQWDFKASTGAIGFRREKRDGRNPSTGARGSRKSGQTITFLTGSKPLTTIEEFQII